MIYKCIIYWFKIGWLNVYDSNVKYCDLKGFLKAQFVIFRCQKCVKKGYMEMRKTIYLEPPYKISRVF